MGFVSAESPRNRSAAYVPLRVETRAIRWDRWDPGLAIRVEPMNLPPKTVSSLMELKERLSAERIEKHTQTLRPMDGEKFSWRDDQTKTPERTMRHARSRGQGYQRFRRQEVSRFYS